MQENIYKLISAKVLVPEKKNIAKWKYIQLSADSLVQTANCKEFINSS